MLPKDPIILLSYINMKLRDYHKSFDDFCKTHGYNPEKIKETLANVNYHYDKENNQFR